MRLTSVARMQTQTGRVSSFSLTADPPAEPLAPEDQLPISFDQARHVGFGSRPGSWMAVAIQLPTAADQAQIAAAWMAVIARHQTLRTVFTHSGSVQHRSVNQDPGTDLSEPELLLTEMTVHPGCWETLAEEASAAEVRETLRRHFDDVCEPFAAPAHRLCVVETPERTPQVIIGADHSHVDAWSLLVLARDLTACLADLQAGRPVGADLPVAQPFAAHTAMLEQRPAASAELTARWREIIRAGGEVMPTFPLPLGDLSVPREEVVEIHDVVDAQELAQLEDYAASHQVRLLAVAVSVLTRLALQDSGQPLRTVFPVHSRDTDQWFDSVGWFITNAVLENDDPGLQASKAAVREAIRLGSTPMEPIMRPYGGMPAAPGMFAMSWLDHRRLPVAVDDALEPQHVSAVIRTDGVMIWFVVNERGLHLRCRYPDTPEARMTMPIWLEAIVAGMREPLEG